MADFEEAGDSEVFRKVRKDTLDAKGIKLDRPADPHHHDVADGRGGHLDQDRKIARG